MFSRLMENGMSKHVEVIQFTDYDWAVGIREPNTTRNIVTIPIKGAVFDRNKRCFTPRGTRKTFLCGSGEFESEIEKFTIEGRDISKATTILFDCKDIKIKHPRKEKSAVPEDILNEIKRARKIFPWGEES